MTIATIIAFVMVVGVMGVVGFLVRVVYKLAHSRPFPTYERALIVGEPHNFFVWARYDELLERFGSDARYMPDGKATKTIMGILSGPVVWVAVTPLLLLTYGLLFHLHYAFALVTGVALGVATSLYYYKWGYRPFVSLFTMWQPLWLIRRDEKNEVSGIVAERFTKELTELDEDKKRRLHRAHYLYLRHPANPMRRWFKHKTKATERMDTIISVGWLLAAMFVIFLLVRSGGA